MRNILVVFTLLISTFAWAQKGKIRGTVIEDANGQTVIGANVVITEPLTGVSTDLDGKFTLEIAPGTYTVKVSFISFQTITIADVVVKDGEVTQLGNIRMKSATLELGTVVVTATATRKSEAALNTMKKKSATMMDGISSEKMALTGDGSAVEAAKRVTGVSIEGGKYIYVRGLGDRYSKVTLNGMDIPGLDPDKNSLQMDIFPTNLIDNILVSKNFTAELPADFTGGLVNIETKSFPEEPILNVSVGISYNPSMHFNDDYLTYEGGKTDWLGYDDGTRKLPTSARAENIPQPFFNPSNEVNAFVSEFNPTLGAERQKSFLNYSASLTMGNQISLNKNNDSKRNPKLGYIFSLSYKQDQTYYDDVVYAEYQRVNNKSDNELIYADKQNGEVGKQNNLVGLLTGLAYKTKLSKYRLTFMHLQNGESFAGKFNLDQNSEAVGRSGYLAYSDNLQYNQRGLSNLMLNGKHVFKDRAWEVDWRSSLTYSTADDPDIRKTAFSYNQVDTSFQAGNAGNPSRIWRSLSETNLVGKIDLTRNYTFLGADAKLKFGTFYSYKERDYEIISTAIQFSGTQKWVRNEANEVLDPRNVYPNGPSYVVSSYQDKNPLEYQANATTVAFYVSNEFNVSEKLKTILGLRVESFEQRHTGRDIDFAQGNGGNNLDNEVVLDGTNLFPSANFIYSLSDDQNLRFAYSRTIARPSFKELSFAQIIDPATGRIFNGSLFAFSGWNGKLEATNIDNLDFRWEYFMPRGQIYSVSFFYKQFDNPIELVRIPLQNTAFEYQPRNVGTGRLVGVELEATKSLNFITEKLDKFSVSGNLTLVRSRVEMAQVEYDTRILNQRVGEEIYEERSMAGQAPYVVNFGLSYQDPEKGLNTGLFYNVKGPTLLIVGTGFVPDIYQVPFHSLNYGFSKKIGEGQNTTIDFQIDNILGDLREEEFKSYQAEDKIFTSFNPGTTFSIGVSYNF